VALVSCTALQVHTRLCYDAGRRLVEQVVVHLAKWHRIQPSLATHRSSAEPKAHDWPGRSPRPCGTPIIPHFHLQGVSVKDAGRKPAALAQALWPNSRLMSTFFPPLSPRLLSTQGFTAVDSLTSPETIWQAVLGELQLSLQRPVFDTWLRDTTAVAYEDGCFVVAAKTAFAQEWLENRMKGMIKQRVQRLTGRSVDLEFIVRPETAPAAESIESEPPLLQPQRETGRYISPPPFPSSLIPSLTFASFIEGEGNRFAYAAAQATVQDPGHRFNPLFMYGGVGLGKTHLLHAIGNSVVRLGYAVRYVTAEMFTNDLIEAIRSKANSDFRQTYREVDVLLIDDIQFIEGKPSTQTEVFHTFNSLYAANKQIVFASDRPPHLFADFDDRLRSRFAGGLTVDLLPPDLELRIAILRSKAFDAGVTVPDDTLRYIAEQCKHNIRELQGGLNRVLAFASLHRQPPTLTLAQEILGDADAALNRDPQAIIQAVAQEFRVTVAELSGPRRSRNIVVPRQATMYLLREVCQLSFPQIGELLGGRDHSTAIHGYEKISRVLDDDIELRSHVERVRVRLRK